MNYNQKINTLIQGRSNFNLVVPKPASELEEYVEIAGIKWATKNLGAKIETDVGLYYQWGDIEGYSSSFEDKQFSYNNDYKWGKCCPYLKYSDDSNPTLQLEDDAAYQFNNNWEIPSDEDFTSLLQNTNYSFVTNYNNSGVDGLLCVDKNDQLKKLFFPCSGKLQEGVHEEINTGQYWTNGLADYPYCAWILKFSEHHIDENIADSAARENGLPIRPIVRK